MENPWQNPTIKMLSFLKHKATGKVWWGAERSKVSYINRIHLKQYKTWVKQISQVSWRNLFPPCILHSQSSLLWPQQLIFSAKLSRLSATPSTWRAPRKTHSAVEHMLKWQTCFPSHHGTPRTKRKRSASSLPSYINFIWPVHVKVQKMLLCFTYFKIGLFQAANHRKSNESDPLYHLGYFTWLFL